MAKRKRKRAKKPSTKPIHTLGDGDIILSEREKVVFDILSRRNAVGADDILNELKAKEATLVAKRGTHSLSVLMKYLAAKACQEGYIIRMAGGGRGQGNKAVYSMEKKF